MPPMIQIPLDLPHVRVLASELTDDGDFLITVESTLCSTTCRECGRDISDFHAFSDPVRLRHLPILDRKVWIILRPKRFRCPHCDGGPTTTQSCSWYELGHATTRDFDRLCLRQLVNATVADTAKKLAVAESLVEGVLERLVEARADWSAWERLGVLGLDEVALRKGRRDFVVLVTTRDEGGRVAILGVLADRTKETVAAFLRSIPWRLRRTITRVCTDMYEGFVRAAADVLPLAKVVIDRFHVARAYGAAADAVRKRETRRLRRELTAEDYERVSGAMWAFRTTEEALDDRQWHLLTRVFTASPEMERAYNLREDLREIFEREQTKAAGIEALRAWCATARRSGLSEFGPVVGMLERMEDGITNYFLARETSGFVEGLDRKSVV